MSTPLPRDRHGRICDRVLALTPGPVDQDIARLGQQRIQRPMFPYDIFETPPTLKAQVR